MVRYESLSIGLADASNVVVLANGHDTLAMCSRLTSVTSGLEWPGLSSVSASAGARELARLAFVTRGPSRTRI